MNRNRSKLIKYLLGNNPTRWMQAATDLSNTELHSSEIQILINLLLNGNYIKQRESAAYALSHCRSCHDNHLHQIFIEILEKGRESINVRAQAAEGLGYMHEFTNKGKKPYKEAVKTLMNLTKDDSPKIRFWAVFSLGLLKARQAIPILKKLAKKDNKVCPGWWAIKDEAADVINYISKGEWPERNRT